MAGEHAWTCQHPGQAQPGALLQEEWGSQTPQDRHPGRRSVPVWEVPQLCSLASLIGGEERDKAGVEPLSTSRVL